MKHTRSLSWLANPSHPCSQLFHTFWNLHDYLNQNQRENSHANEVVIQPPTPNVVMLTTELTTVSAFWAHIPCNLISSLFFLSIYLLLLLCFPGSFYTQKIYTYHIPLKCTYSYSCYVGFRYIHLNTLICNNSYSPIYIYIEREKM